LTIVKLSCCEKVNQHPPKLQTLKAPEEQRLCAFLLRQRQALLAMAHVAHQLLVRHHRLMQKRALNAKRELLLGIPAPDQKNLPHSPAQRILTAQLPQPVVKQQTLKAAVPQQALQRYLQQPLTLAQKQCFLLENRIQGTQEQRRALMIARLADL
jgi:hypothetical protein